MTMLRFVVVVEELELRQWLLFRACPKERRLSGTPYVSSSTAARFLNAKMMLFNGLRKIVEAKRTDDRVCLLPLIGTRENDG